MEYTHDPSEYIRGLQQLLISDKKRIAFLFGAGTSAARKNKNSITVPMIEKLTEIVIEELSNENSKYENVFKEIKDELGDKFNIETILSNLEQKLRIIGKGILNNLNVVEFEDLIKKLKEKIRLKISVHENKKNEDFKDLVQADFAKWIGKIDRKCPVEIFTTNYDYLFELGLEYYNVPYYDGFSGSYKPFFNSDSVECMNFLPNQTKLWKIHGSLGWQLDDENGNIVRVNSNDKDILIYPSILKYKDSKKQPYASLMDRLLNFLKTDDTILITCGYSFADEHINERIQSALNSNTSSHLIILYYGNLYENSKLRDIASLNTKISIYSQRSAIIGGKYGIWKLKYEPTKEDTVNVNLYYDEDFDDTLDIGEGKGLESYSGKGSFILPDFANLAKFLSSMMTINEIGEWGKNVK